KRVEGMNFDIRKTLLEYDDVLRQQRETMYTQRDEILENDDVHSIIEAMFERFADDLVDSYTDYSQRNPIVNKEALAAAIDKMSGSKTAVADVLAALKEVEDIKKASFDALWESYENKIEEIRDEMIKLEKVIVLKIIDAKWIDHIDLMSKLRDGIHLRSYAQDNPLKAYTQEGYEMFETMMDNISKEVVNFCSSCRIEFGRRQR
ncbi:MAG TPA: preprotein translocase subunit SecA, partial [Erysipelotrichaceae bacterium]|nr:preprotein translocase subunit SecA [Erysipelotrichaceae bacterium]